MDKPVSLSVKQFLIRKMSVYMAVPEKTIEAVVGHQFTTLLDGMKTMNSLELSGFGKFVYNEKKGYKILEKHLANLKRCEEMLKDASPQKQKGIRMRMESIYNNIESLKPKIDVSKYTGDFGGMEKPSDSSRASEGEDCRGFC